MKTMQRITTLVIAITILTALNIMPVQASVNSAKVEKNITEYAKTAFFEVNSYNEEELFLERYDFPELSELEKLTEVTTVFLEMEVGYESDDGEVPDYNYCLNALTLLPNLTTLELHENIFDQDISAITKLTGLKSLSIYDRHGHGDISPVSKLTNLVELNIENSYSAIDLSIFEGLVNLSRLHIYTHYGDIINHDSLAKLKSLESLTLETESYGMSTRFTDLGVLAELPKLTELSLLGEFPDLSAFSKLTNLISLKIVNTYFDAGPITDITPLMALTNLDELSLSGLKLKPIIPANEK
jgi:hypothetical protein